ncbi:cobalamin biosynthesis protein [Desulforhopalus vacuolatus]|uniref:cobalamin biosynthesis protein n=1 Tax=Desulforhopalus vacuolatus TaxID=40414 RepID=UPI00196404FA|nr:cobalamin biosynthesis protein [Desulforhopalus vacuolatus]
MKIAILALTSGGIKLAQKLEGRLNASVLPKKRGEKFSGRLARAWSEYDAFICIMATGIVVRAIAPLLRDKTIDPCVLVMDEKGNNVISLLSGHLGGGNALTLRVAQEIGANPVITTASDTLKLAALDLWAQEMRLVPPPRPQLNALSARLVNEGRLRAWCDVEVTGLPQGLEMTTHLKDADFLVSHRLYAVELPQFYPQNVVIGTGCNRDTPAEEFETAMTGLLSGLGLARQSIRNLASIDAKNNEVGLLHFAEKNRWSIDFFDRDAINTLKNLEISFAAMKAVGAIGVAEPTCLLSAGSEVLLSRKRKWKNITMAAALAPFTLSVPAPEAKGV